MSNTRRITPEPDLAGALDIPAAPVDPEAGTSTRHHIERQLRQAVINGLFSPGEHLPDRVLCERFGASRSLVREAVRLLEAEGLLTVHANRGTFVTVLTTADATHLYEVRSVLEALAGEGCATRATGPEREALRKAYLQLERLPEDTQPAVFLAYKQVFYDSLLLGCHNPLVTRMVNQLLNRLTELRAKSLQEPGRLKQLLAELRRMAEAIEQSDPEGAWDACRSHVRRSAALGLRILRARTPGLADPAGPRSD